MYVCLCNALKEKDIIDVMQAKGCDVENVHDALGCSVRCGCCLDYIETQLATCDGTPVMAAG